MLLPAPAAASSPTAITSSTYDSGVLQVAFPSPLPQVHLALDASPNIAATLTIDHLVELVPGNSSHPTLARVADAFASAGFNSTESGGIGRFGVGLSGTLPVRSSGTPLWQTPGVAPFAINGTPISETGLSVAYQLLPLSGGTEGLRFAWNITNWPWQSASDLVGLEFNFSVLTATGFRTCTSEAASNQCGGSSLSPGGILWASNSLGGVVASDGAVAEAALLWSPANLASPAAPLVAGAYYDAAGDALVTVAAQDAGSSQVAGSAEFVLVLPPTTHASALSTSPWVWSAAVALFGGLALGGIAYARRRDRELSRNL